MALDYKRAESIWAQKRMKEYKPMMLDLRLRKLEDGSFTVHRAGSAWSNGKWSKDEYPFAKLTPDNMLTVLVEGRPTQTEANRLSELLGCTVHLNANRYRGYESTVRVLSVGLIKSSIPYHTGLMFDMTPRGPVCVNPVADRKTIKSPEMKAQMSKELDTLRKLTIGMTRMGVFDDIIRDKIQHRYTRVTALPLAQVDAADPSADHAMAVVLSGLNSADSTAYQWVNGTYVKYSEDELIQMLRKKAITNGFRHLRDYLYNARHGYTQVSA